MFIDNDFPKLLGAELYRPHPAYIVEMAAEPVDLQPPFWVIKKWKPGELLETLLLGLNPTT